LDAKIRIYCEISYRKIVNTIVLYAEPLSKQAVGEDDEENHEELGCSVHADGLSHIGGAERSGILANERLGEQLTEVVVGTTETTVEDACQCSLGPATVGTGMTTGIAMHKTEQGRQRARP
jgi:hypothetical protein